MRSGTFLKSTLSRTFAPHFFKGSSSGIRFSLNLREDPDRLTDQIYLEGVMALITKIRNKMWMVIILLALGLGGFVFMDISSVNNLRGNNQFHVGKVNGDEINWLDFQRAQEALYTNSQVDVNSQRDFVWTYFVEEAILRQEAENIGLSVGDEELNELQFGARLSPVVQRNFTDPATGQVNRESLASFRQAAEQGTLAPQFQKIWAFQQEEVVKERLDAKLTTLVKKGIYTPTWMAEAQQKELSNSVDFKYVQIPFDKVDDSELKLTDADYAAYVRDNSAQYQRQMEMRDARYVVFDVFPTPEDTMALLEGFNQSVAEFKSTEDDSTFVTLHNGTYDARYYKKDELAEVISDVVFAIAIDSVYGPYIDGDAYKAVKVLDRQSIPDSVRSRHILIRVQQQEEVPAALALVDSLETVLKEDFSKFDTLARRFSNDAVSAAKGGDLGFIGLDRFGKPMNDLLFFEKTERGKAYRVLTEFGIHLVEVTEKKADSVVIGAKLAYISAPIVPSEATQDAMYDDALEFAGQNRTLDALKATVESRGDLVLEEAKNLPQHGYDFGTLPSGNTAREIVRWLFDPGTELGDVAPTVFVIQDDANYFNSQYVVAGLEAIHEKGLATPESIMDQIEAPVKNKKRSEILISKISTTDLEALSQQFNVSIDSVENVNFGIQAMKNIGEEPEVLAAALKLEEGQVSKPIPGRNGVYVIQVISKIESTLPQNLAQLRRQATFQIANSAEFELMDALKKNAKIKDNRYTFF
jgi:peptidyl-prolyl cis-trans isomerase D